MTAMLLPDLVNRFDGIRVLVVGDPMLDEYVIGDCTRLSPEAPIPVLKVRETRSVLGGAANTAANVAALGGQAVLVGVVGNDEAGRRLSELAAARGVTTAFVQDDRPTARKVRALGGQQQLLRLDYEDDSPVAGSASDAALARVRTHLAGASVLVVSDYAKGLISTTFCQQLLALAREAGVPVVVDPRPQHARAYVGCDYLTPNWKEAQALLGDIEAAPSPAVVEAVGRRLVERFGANVLLTLGAHGIRFFGRDGVHSFDEPARAREVFDVSGAGDTVVATFALALSAGADVQTSLRLANRAAGIVVAKVGTATVSREELLEAPEDRGRLVDRQVLLDRLREARASGRRVGVVTGSFEAIHGSNLEQLREVRRQVDVLVVGVRGNHVNARERAAVLLGLRDVDLAHVIADDEPGFVRTLAPDIHLEETSPATTRSEPS